MAAATPRYAHPPAAARREEHADDAGRQALAGVTPEDRSKRRDGSAPPWRSSSPGSGRPPCAGRRPWPPDDHRDGNRAEEVPGDGRDDHGHAGEVDHGPPCHDGDRWRATASPRSTWCGSVPDTRWPRWPGSARTASAWLAAVRSSGACSAPAAGATPASASTPAAPPCLRSGTTTRRSTPSWPGRRSHGAGGTRTRPTRSACDASAATARGGACLSWRGWPAAPNRRRRWLVDAGAEPGPVAVLTRATVRVRHWPAFIGAGRRVSPDVAAAPASSPWSASARRRSGGRPPSASGAAPPTCTPSPTAAPTTSTRCAAPAPRDGRRAAVRPLPALRQPGTWDGRNPLAG